MQAIKLFLFLFFSLSFSNKVMVKFDDSLIDREKVEAIYTNLKNVIRKSPNRMLLYRELCNFYSINSKITHQELNFLKSLLPENDLKLVLRAALVLKRFDDSSYFVLENPVKNIVYIKV